jgi:hypothetical protein
MDFDEILETVITTEKMPSGKNQMNPKELPFVTGDLISLGKDTAIYQVTQIDKDGNFKMIPVSLPKISK